MDGNFPLRKCLIQGTHQLKDTPPCDWIPAVHAGMTSFDHLCITMSEDREKQARLRLALTKQALSLQPILSLQLVKLYSSTPLPPCRGCRRNCRCS